MLKAVANKMRKSKYKIRKNNEQSQAETSYHLPPSQCSVTERIQDKSTQHAHPQAEVVTNKSVHLILDLTTLQELWFT